jgi:hypothetical protein
MKRHDSSATTSVAATWSNARQKAKPPVLVGVVSTMIG